MREYKPAGGPMSPVTSGRIYEADEWEFIAAVEAWKKKNRRCVPAWSEVLAIARGLGYRKAPPEVSPGNDAGPEGAD